MCLLSKTGNQSTEVINFLVTHHEMSPLLLFWLIWYSRKKWNLMVLKYWEVPLRCSMWRIQCSLYHRVGLIPGPALWVEDLALLQLWHRSKLQLEFNPWPRNFHMPWIQGQGGGRYTHTHIHTRARARSQNPSLHQTCLQFWSGFGGFSLKTSFFNKYILRRWKLFPCITTSYLGDN